MFKFITVLIIIHKASILTISLDNLTSRNALDFINAFDMEFFLRLLNIVYVDKD